VRSPHLDRVIFHRFRVSAALGTVTAIRRRMPSHHDSLVAMLHRARDLLPAWLLPELAAQGVRLPHLTGDLASPEAPPSIVELPASLLPADLATLTPDAVFGLVSRTPRRSTSRRRRRAHPFVALLAAEVQLREDEDKPWRWDRYGGFLCDKYRVPCHVIVLAPRRSVHRWIRRRLAIHAAWGRPIPLLLLGPDQFRALASRAATRDSPALTVFCALALAAERDPSPEARRALEEAVATALKALVSLPESELAWYASHLFAHAPAPPIAITEDEVHMIIDGVEVTHPALLHLLQRTSAARAEGVEVGRAEGVEVGRARGRLLTLAEVRGLALTPDQAARVEAETDVALLQRWADRAKVAASAAEVFADG
jgi:hypothetical protein